MTALDRLAPRVQGQWRAVIETPQGSRNKLKFLPAEEVFQISESLPAGMSFPFDFGFIPGTRGEDGDPLDVLVLMDAPGFPGAVVEISLLGVIEAEEKEKGHWIRNDRLIAVARGTRERGHLHRLADLEPDLLQQICSFFVTYSGLIGKRYRFGDRHGPSGAVSRIEAATTGAST